MSMPEALPKKHSSSEELGSWFQNRGLFSDHFLKARLPQWKEQRRLVVLNQVDRGKMIGRQVAEVLDLSLVLLL